MLKALAVAFLCFSAAHAQVDTVAVHGRIWTEDPAHPEVQAMAISAHRILATGTDAEIMQLAGANTHTIDLGGRRVVPGFNDSHVHLFAGGQGLASVQLLNARSREEFTKRIANFAKTRPHGEWILNGNWDEQKWTPVELPSHEWIDAVTPDNPVCVQRSDGHMMLANAVAMKLAGVTRSTPDVPGGVIVRDRNGNPTGIFKDAAKAMVEKIIPPPTDAQVDAALLAAQHEALRYGVTSVQDMGFYGANAADLQALVVRGYQRLIAENKWKLRVSARFLLNDADRLSRLGIMTNFGNDTLVIGSLKAFADGSLGSATAWFNQPFDDQPGNAGQPNADFADQGAFFHKLQAADLAGNTVAVHAIGDKANQTVLDLFERLEKEDGSKDRRLRIEHAQHLRPEDIPRFAQLHVIASVQPYHAIDDGRWAEKRIGHRRAATTYPFKSLIDSGATVALGTDWFVAPIDPMETLYAATTRRTLDGKNPNGWFPEQRLTIQQAVHAYTVNSAYAEAQEQFKGALKPGMLADFDVLSEDIFAIDPVDLQRVKVLTTVLGGEVVAQQ